MRRCLTILFLIVALTPCGAAAERPNILLILADNVGIEGLGCYGGVSYRTPNLDRLAKEGVRFTHAYSQPLCTPTRVQLMTGKYNHRNWRSFGILDPQEKTLGNHMTAAGYATGIFGKWQLQSYDPPDFPGAARRRGTGMHPKDAGFREYALFHALHTEDKGSRYANPTLLEGTAGSAGALKTHAGKYGPDVWVDKILEFMERHRQQPVFVYYPMALPHWPFQPTPKSPGWDPGRPQETDLRYAADMIEYMDTAVGSLVKGMRDRDLHHNTIVMFYSDNGTHREVFSVLQDGRTVQGGKGTPRQTGIHVPLIVHAPGRIAPAVCDDIVDASDILPTILELAGSPLSKDTLCDGVSFVPSLLGREGPRRETAFFWYDPRPGWDKERYGRVVFALNLRYKLFRSGELFRLTDRALEEIPVDPLKMTEADRQAKAELGRVIERMLADVIEPPLVNAFGEPQSQRLSHPPD